MLYSLSELYEIALSRQMVNLWLLISKIYFVAVQENHSHVTDFIFIFISRFQFFLNTVFAFSCGRP